jgi:hypothetical protein
MYGSCRSYQGLGGILYQAAVLCGLGEDVYLYTNCGLELKADVEKITGNWRTLRTAGLNYVPGPGNQVFLRYSERSREREETLASAVPPLTPDRIFADLPKLDALLMAFNSGFDMALGDWRRIIERASCPIWLDIHSLVLEKKFRGRREYVSLLEWRDWVSGADYLQANRQEIASLLGHPERWPEHDEISAFIQESLQVDVRAVFITMGKEGVLVATAEEMRIIRAPEAEKVVDTTGCGDVFCARTLQLLARDIPVFEAASRGVEMASRAVGIAGIMKTYSLARQTKK